jgi:hypothetical protein
MMPMLGACLGPLGVLRKNFPSPRFNLNNMAGISDASLLPAFTSLTGMLPDCPIPPYLRADSSLFFINMATYRAAPAAAAPATVSAATAATEDAVLAAAATTAASSQTAASGLIAGAPATAGPCTQVAAAVSTAALGPSPSTTAVPTTRARSMKVHGKGKTSPARK